MKSAAQTKLDAEQKKVELLAPIEPAVLEGLDQQSIVTAVNEINNAVASKKKGYKEGNKNDSDTGKVEEK